MPSSIPHQKFYFYHLPTRGRAGINLGDAWYVSNVSIIFYCSMLYYILFWTLMGFIIHFYIIFGTKLLTGGPAQNCCFFPISEFRRKRILNGVQTEWNSPRLERFAVQWYVSNVFIIFDCYMLYYILFWTLLGFIIHFYIIFGTNLLTGGPAQNCCFLPISVFRRNGISNEVQTE